MIVLRLSLALIIASLFTTSAEAQLFRFRNNQRMNYSQQQYGYPSQYNAQTYQYTEVQPQTDYVPSQRGENQSQQPACNRQQAQTGLVPANSFAASQQLQRQQVQQRLQQLLRKQTEEAQQTPAGERVAAKQKSQQQLNAAQQSEIVTVTYRDPYSGRLFQRQFLVQNAAQPAQQATADKAGQKIETARASVSNSPTSVLSSASPIGVVTPDLVPAPNAGDVRTTSFESEEPITPSGSAVEYSVLNRDTPETTEANPVLELTLPELETPTPTSETPGSLLESDLDLDLPPLELDDAK